MTAGEGARAPGAARLVAVVLVPFGLAHLLSYLFRTVNAVIAPELARDIALSAADLGLLTSTYFLAFAAFQVPLGVLLDRYGPRRVQSVLLLVAASGAALFALSDSLAGLAVARALIGCGVSGGLMSAFKANVLWWPRARLPLVNSCIAAFGSAGALAATVPVEVGIHIVGWRGIFVLLTAAAVAVAMLIRFAVPERSQPQPARRFAVRGELAELATIYTNRLFWRLSVLLVAQFGTMMAYQALWAGPWLRDGLGLDRLAAANALMMIALGNLFGLLLIGVIADRIQAYGIRPLALVVGGIACSVAVQLALVLGPAEWALALCFAYGFCAGAGLLTYAVLAQTFPAQLVGRVHTAQNMLAFLGAFAVQWGVGALVSAFPESREGAYDPAGQQVAWLIMIAIQVAALVWFQWSGRSGRASAGVR